MSHHSQLVELRLGNQHAVKGIAVVAGQVPGDKRVRDRDGEGLEATRSASRSSGMSSFPCARLILISQALAALTNTRVCPVVCQGYGSAVYLLHAHGD